MCHWSLWVFSGSAPRWLQSWRDLPLITIDPADAKDHDDAVYAELDPSPDNPDGVIVTVAIASDCNPGSSYTTSMPLMIALAVREMGLSPAQAVWAATAGGAASLQRNDIGVITPGRRADLIALDAPTHVHLAYRPGVPLVSHALCQIHFKQRLIWHIAFIG